MDIMASSSQRKGGCGHIMANFDTHVVVHDAKKKVLVYREKMSVQHVCF